MKLTLVKKRQLEINLSEENKYENKKNIMKVGIDGNDIIVGREIHPFLLLPFTQITNEKYIIVVLKPL